LNAAQHTSTSHTGKDVKIIPFLAIVFAICAIALSFASNRPRQIYRVDKNGGMNYFRLYGYNETPPPAQGQTDPR